MITLDFASHREALVQFVGRHLFQNYFQFSFGTTWLVLQIIFSLRQVLYKVCFYVFFFILFVLAGFRLKA